MESEPGGDGGDVATQSAGLQHGAARTHDDRDEMGTVRASSRSVAAEPRPIPGTMARTSSGHAQAPRLRLGELHRRRSQTFYSGSGSESPSRGTGVQRPTARPQLAAARRTHGSSSEVYRPGAAAAATRERMYQMLEAAASAESLVPSPTSPTRTPLQDTQDTPLTTTRPIAIPRRRQNVDVEMLEASMPPPPAPTTARSNNAASSTAMSSSLPLETREELAASSSSANGGGGLKRSASNSSQTVTIYECPILEVDEQCGDDGGKEDLSWLTSDRELEQMLALASSHGRHERSSLSFKRSSEAAMQCSQVVRNVPRMRKRRDRKMDRRRQSLTLSESTICLSASPSPTATPVG